MSDRHADVVAWAADRGVAGAVEVYDPAGGRAAASAAGRRAAARALAALGAAPLGPDDREPDGRPRWPAGFTGSITRRDGVALAMAARRAEVRAVGVDREARHALPLADAAFVLDDDELAWAGAHPDPDDAAGALWSAKEAAFKAWNEAAGGALPPVDPRRHLHVDLRADGSVRVVPRHELATAAVAVEGRAWREADAIVTLVVLPLTPPAAAGP